MSDRGVWWLLLSWFSGWDLVRSCGGEWEFLISWIGEWELVRSCREVFLVLWLKGFGE